MENIQLWPGWDVVEHIGSGAFSDVYKIKKNDTSGDFFSALKVISVPKDHSEYRAYKTDGYDDESITQIFKNQVDDLVKEFKLMSRFRGTANIVSYEDHMIVPKSDSIGWNVLIRMELLTTLPDYYINSTLNEADTLKLGIDICRALELCEKFNIVHRDIKPQNIFVNDFGDFKLGDFGVARAMEHTTHATKIGTYSYMAPEVYRGDRYNCRADIYSLGMVLYWLLNERRLPFVPLPPNVPTPAENNEAQTRRMNGEPLPPPKNGSEALKRIVLRACAPNSLERFKNAAEMGAALKTLSHAAPASYSNQTVVPRNNTNDVPPPAIQYSPNSKNNGVANTDRATPAQQEKHNKVNAAVPNGNNTQNNTKKQSSKNFAKAILVVICALLIIGIGAVVIYIAVRDSDSQDFDDYYKTVGATSNKDDTTSHYSVIGRDDTTSNYYSEDDRRIEETSEATSSPASGAYELPDSLSDVHIGDYISFGAYEQDNNTSNGKEAIEWLVLDIQDGRALVISKYGLDAKPYNTEYEDVSWETCTLRQWLNNDFLNSAFSSNELSYIPTVTVSADKNPNYDTNPGNETKDKVFLLSVTEADKYFANDDERICQATKYAQACGQSSCTKGNCWWWLRSPGMTQYCAAVVYSPGSIMKYGTYVNASLVAEVGSTPAHDYPAVRPAMWIKLEDYDIPEQSENDSISTSPEPSINFGNVQPGDYISFGAYEQDNNTSNGKEDIEWLVLDVQGDKALIISKYVLDCKQYNTVDKDVTWESCTIRQWLNNDFFSNAFSAEEKASISATTVTVDDGSSYNATQDNVFLLSIAEAEKYFDYDIERKCLPTDYAEAQGVYVSATEANYGHSWWWLRSVGASKNTAANIGSSGGIYKSGTFVSYDNGAVRPALWIELNF